MSDAVDGVPAADAAARATNWAKARCGGFLEDPFGGMGDAGLFRLGIPAPFGDDGGYAAIAAGEAALASATGLPGLATSWAGRQLTARFFLAGFGSEAQKAEWLPRLASGEVAPAIGISEPGAGAHPKLLTTRAVADGDHVVITGEKAWATNGPIAGLFIVLAITSEEEGRKRYGAFLVPRDAPGLSLKEMPEFRHLLQPSGHCGLVLDGVRVPASARLGPEGRAYEAMALPFRDLEDAVGSSGLVGALGWLAGAVARALAKDGALDDEAAQFVGGLKAEADLARAGAEALAAAADARRLMRAGGTLIGVRLVAQGMLDRVKASGAYRQGTHDAIERVVGDLGALLGVARGPRLARQAALGRTLLGSHNP
jgi:acyl-CoA dehydrogenase